jgi:hypothetical protein
MTVTIIQELWKEGSKKKKLLWKCLWLQGYERKATRKIIYCGGVCDHMVFWNFRLRFEPLGLPPLTTSILVVLWILSFYYHSILPSILIAYVSQPHFGQVWGWSPNLEKLEVWSPRDSWMFRARQQGPKHLALGRSWCHWKGLET